MKKRERIIYENRSVDKKPLKKKKNHKDVSLLKELLRATEISKKILDLNVNLTVGELIVSTLLVEKNLIKALSLDEVVEFYVNALGLSNTGEFSSVEQ